MIAALYGYVVYGAIALLAAALVWACVRVEPRR